jgi:hypothetical protein
VHIIEKFEPSCDKPCVRREIRVESFTYIAWVWLVRARARVGFLFLVIYISI